MSVGNRKPAVGGSPDKVWLAWEDDSSIRSRVLAEALGAEFHAFTTLNDRAGFGWLRYLVALTRTAWLLARRRPALVVAQNPSILLAWQAARLKSLFGYGLIVDLHTQFHRPKGWKKTIYDHLHLTSLKLADAVIVTNDAYRKEVEADTSQPVLVLPDKVPELEPPERPQRLTGAHNVLYICTFSEDEPWREVLSAAGSLAEGTRIYVSGKSPIPQDGLPANVELTGFLPTPDYQGLLQSVDAIMVLTTAENNLVCGGYEAVAAQKPLILSDTRALRSYFRRGVVYTENDAGAIAEAIGATRSRREFLEGEMRELRSELTEEWHGQWREILAHVDALGGTA